MIYELAQFPLPLVLFPAEVIPLHIFEPRYQQLIADCEADGINFGILPVIDGVRQDTGTSVSLEAILKRYPEGRLDIQVKGEHRFRIVNWDVNSVHKPYLIAQVEDLPENTISDQALAGEILTQMEELYRLMRIPPEHWPSQLNLGTIIHKLALPVTEEYKLLCLQDSIAKQRYILQRLKELIPKVQEVEKIRKIIEMNGQPRLFDPSIN